MTTSAVRAKVLFADGADICVACYASAGEHVKFIAIEMPKRIPVDPGFAAVLDDQEELVVCSDCVGAAARVLGLYREPSADPDVKRLAAAREAALQRLAEADRELAELQARGALEAGT